MRIIKTLLAFSLVCAFQAGSVVAADWTGLYVGVNQASQNLTGSWNTTETRNPGSAEIASTSDTMAVFDNEETDLGARVGFGLGLGSFVLGVEAVHESIEHEFSIDNRIPGLGDTSSDPTSYVNVRAESGGPVLRLRAGYLIIDNLLLYATTGKSELDVSVTSTCPADTNVCNPAEGTQSSTSEKTLSENAKGFGVEFSFLSFKFRVERLEVDYGDFSFTALPENNNSYGADATVAFESEVTQLGFGYQFF